ncbi:hypothetical protein LX32DRAFT_252711 [Colletotrichum zoysiae]|uniref:Uncharacterized protein n=1 Tax=Colletotrichum zoysiae TaxID=1216348 RepID=A0AAD9HTU9_9PEZI|nr:hypothetical protein LX32DRAFT_252711 [Colletotrichum zoysiae]
MNVSDASLSSLADSLAFTPALRHTAPPPSSTGAGTGVGVNGDGGSKILEAKLGKPGLESSAIPRYALLRCHLHNSSMFLRGRNIRACKGSRPTVKTLFSSCADILRPILALLAWCQDRAHGFPIVNYGMNARPTAGRTRSDDLMQVVGSLSCCPSYGDTR